jgi:RNA polymerase sigma-70 factor, ECF subfamily
MRPDLDAIKRLKNGDIAGLEYLIERYQLKAVRAAYFIVQDEHTAEDVVQEVFIRIYEGIRHFNDTYPFEPYLMRCVVNKAIDVAGKKENTALKLDNDHLEPLLNLMAQAESVEGQVEQAEINRSILAAVAQLPLRERAVVVQRYYLEMSEKEMSVVLDSAPGTVKWLLSTARARLRYLLKDQRSDE